MSASGGTSSDGASAAPVAMSAAPATSTGAGAGAGAGSAGAGSRDGVRFIDVGANLVDTMFQGEYRGSQKHEPDLDVVLERAWAAGLEKIVVTGTSLAESRQALELARKHDRLYCTVGVHPTNCGQFESAPAGDGDGGTRDADAADHPLGDDHLAALLALAQAGAKEGKVVAIGECGLDYDRLHFCDKETQAKYFEWHFRLAEETGLPMFLHNRNTGLDMVEALKRNAGRFCRAVVHSFDGTAEELAPLLEMDNVWIGINGCSLREAGNLEVMASIPLERLVLETDAPWCGVRPTHAGAKHLCTKFKDKKPNKYTAGMQVKGRNEPCNIRQVAEVVAGARGVDLSVVVDAAFENTQRLFFPSELA